MGLTYTSRRDLQRRRDRWSAFSLGEQLLLLTSIVTMAAIALAYVGRIRAEAWGASSAPAPINLNVVNSVEDIEQPLSAVFQFPADRRFAAQAVAAFLRPTGGLKPADYGDQIPNVGALSKIQIRADAIDKQRGLVVFRERLDAARLSAADTHKPPPVTIPLLSAADLAVLKPLVSVRTIGEFRSAVLWSAVALLLAFHAVSLAWRWRGTTGDRILLAAVHLLVGIGFVLILSRPDPLRDTLLLVRYTQGVVFGLILFSAVSMVDLERAAFRELSYVPLVCALGLSVLLLVFGTGPGSSNAKVNLWLVQPIEAIRLLLALFLAGYFARRWELLRQVRTESVGARRLPEWINLPRLVHVLPVVAGVAMALVLFFFQKDLGPALLLSLMFLSLFAVARGGAWLASAGFAGLVAGFGIGFILNISNTLAARLQMWQSPWDNAVRGGDQVAQGLWGLAAGAIGGTGVGLGQTRFVPEGHTDLVLAAVGEELGFVGLLIVAALFTLIALRGFRIAMRASSDYRFFLALAMTLSLTIPVLVMASGILGALPLTGVVTPFLSYGGSAMAANFVALGLLVAVDRDRRQPADLAPFHVPVRWLGRVAAVAAVGVLTVAATVQTVRADDYLVRPQLSVQADGGRRFQYNPRVLSALRTVPRGTIFDRQGQPLATSDPAIITKAADKCPNPGERCYLAGPSLTHVLGDANSRLNWSAANTSYVERDSEDRLRGFDDRAATITTADREGRPALAVRRDYSPMIALVRHRFEPDHPAVTAILARNRDVTLSIDSRFQTAVASIVERAARATTSGKAAVVVLDAETGQLLASVSYPWPSSSGPDGLIDRARYGLYPPGSTFKMITAAAALRGDADGNRREFVCQRLSKNRIGVRIPGFGPPIVDDVHDAEPHGRIAMHDAMVRSCNAYFAQLAVALGSETLARTAAAAGITLNTSRTPERIRANLPHSGYGQGEVVATPLRMARVAAALGTNGIIREAPLVIGPAGTIDTVFASPVAARTLSSYLRDAVVAGTGRLLKDHPARIAGKTGTAEVDEAGSHAWFVGFAPYGPATRRIAFAVVLENAGYGGVAAANVAGQIATVAVSMGLVK